MNWDFLIGLFLGWSINFAGYYVSVAAERARWRRRQGRNYRAAYLAKREAYLEKLRGLPP